MHTFGGMPPWRWKVAAVLIAGVLLAVVGRSVFDTLQPGHATVGTYFDNPPSYPGPPWTRDGVEVGNEVLSTAAGPEHCGWQSATLMFVGWPLGTDAKTSNQARQYVRDKSGKIVPPQFSRGTWEHNPALPLDAYDSGFRYDGVLKLYLAPSDDDSYLYLLAPADSERWPRSDPMTICM